MSGQNSYLWLTFFPTTTQILTDVHLILKFCLFVFFCIMVSLDHILLLLYEDGNQNVPLKRVVYPQPGGWVGAAS